MSDIAKGIEISKISNSDLKSLNDILFIFVTNAKSFEEKVRAIHEQNVALHFHLYSKDRQISDLESMLLTERSSDKSLNVLIKQIMAKNDSNPTTERSLLMGFKTPESALRAYSDMMLNKKVNTQRIDKSSYLELQLSP